jgi:hypothetical protein
LVWYGYQCCGAETTCYGSRAGSDFSFLFTCLRNFQVKRRFFLFLSYSIWIIIFKSLHGAGQKFRLLETPAKHHGKLWNVWYLPRLWGLETLLPQLSRQTRNTRPLWRKYQSRLKQKWFRRRGAAFR